MMRKDRSTLLIGGRAWTAEKELKAFQPAPALRLGGRNQAELARFRKGYSLTALTDIAQQFGNSSGTKLHPKVQGQGICLSAVIPAGFWRQSRAAPLLDSRLKFAEMTESSCGGSAKLTTLIGNSRWYYPSTCFVMISFERDSARGV